MSDKPKIETSLAETIPPLELDHKLAYELLLATDPKVLTDPDFDKLVTGYRDQRRRRAAMMLEKKLKAEERERKKAEVAARKAEKEAKRKAKENEGK